MKTKHVLIVDDEFVSNLILSKFLEEYSEIDYKSFSNGEEIKQYLVDNPDDEADFLFLDLRMPVMNGFEFLEWYEKSNRQHKAKIYVLSSSLDSRDVDRAKNYNCVVDFIEKPISPEILKNIIL